MKKSFDHKEIPDRIWYYLLDFNDKNKVLFHAHTGRHYLSDCTQQQIMDLFKVATTHDYLEEMEKVVKA